MNNAGVSVLGGATTDEATFEDGWRHTFAVNLDAHARLVRAALPYLQASGAGRIVNIASTEGVIATGGLAAYTASKHGVIGLTKSLAVELGRTGVTVNCICPGPIRTGMTAGIPEEAKETYAHRKVPLRRYGEPEEVAHGTLNFVLPASSFMNGAVLVGRRRHDDPPHVMASVFGGDPLRGRRWLPRLERVEQRVGVRGFEQQGSVLGLGGSPRRPRRRGTRRAARSSRRGRAGPRASRAGRAGST